MFEFRFETPRMNMDAGAAGGGGDFGGSAAAPQASPQAAPQAAPQAPSDSYGRSGQNPLSQWAQGVQEPAQQPQAAAPEELDFAGRKVPVTDPIIKELHRDYSHLQRTYQDTTQTMRTLQEQNQMFSQMLQTFQQQQAPQAQAPVEPQAPSQEDIDSLMSEWYENPRAVLQKYAEEAIKPFIEPIQKERQYQEQVQSLSQKYTDFQDMVPSMQQVIQGNPQWAEQQSLETIFLMARGQQPTPQVPTMEQLLQDPNFRQQLMADESLRNEFRGQYVQESHQRNQQIPPVMGGAPGGNIPAAPENKPRTVREATRGLARSLGLGG